MFISKADKQRIETLLDAARNKIAVLEARVTVLENAKPAKVKKPKKVLTPEQKAKQRAYQIEYKKRMKAKLQGAANVSA